MQLDDSGVLMDVYPLCFSHDVYPLCFFPWDFLNSFFDFITSLMRGTYVKYRMELQ